MLSHNRFTPALALLLAGCAGGGYAAPPRLADPTAAEAYPAADAPPGDRGDDSAYQPETPARTGTNYPAPGERPTPADLPPDVAAGTGPRGTSGEAQRYDAVGYASWYGEEMGAGRTASGQPFDAGAVTAAHRTLPLGSVVEITALDTGRTILVLVNDRGPGSPDREIDLSRGAAQQLGLTTAMSPVRVRLVTPTPSDMMALRSGQPAAPRIDSPPTLLAALRRRLPVRAAIAPSPRRPIGRPAPVGTDDGPPSLRAPVTAGIFVQVAALSNEGRAQALATNLQGRVQHVGALYRVQIGPFANRQKAQQARDEVARRGYGDARIVQTN